MSTIHRTTRADRPVRTTRVARLRQLKSMALDQASDPRHLETGSMEAESRLAAPTGSLFRVPALEKPCRTMPLLRRSLEACPSSTLGWARAPTSDCSSITQRNYSLTLDRHSNIDHSRWAPVGAEDMGDPEEAGTTVPAVTGKEVTETVGTEISPRTATACSRKQPLSIMRNSRGWITSRPMRTIGREVTIILTTTRS